MAFLMAIPFLIFFLMMFVTLFRVLSEGLGGAGILIFCAIIVLLIMMLASAIQS